MVAGVGHFGRPVAVKRAGNGSRTEAVAGDGYDIKPAWQKELVRVAGDDNSDWRS